MNHIIVDFGRDLGQAKLELEKARTALEIRDDFILWLVEIKFEDEYSLSELWDEFDQLNNLPSGEK